MTPEQQTIEFLKFLLEKFAHDLIEVSGYPKEERAARIEESGTRLEQVMQTALGVPPDLTAMYATAYKASLRERTAVPHEETKMSRALRTMRGNGSTTLQ